LLPGTPPQPALQPTPALPAGRAVDPGRGLRVAVLLPERLRDPRHQPRVAARGAARLEGEASGRARGRHGAAGQEGLSAPPPHQADKRGAVASTSERRGGGKGRRLGSRVLAPRATRSCRVPPKLQARAGAAEVAEPAPLPAPHVVAVVTRGAVG